MKNITIPNTHRGIIAIFWVVLALTIWSQINRDFPLWPGILQCIIFLLGAFISAHILSDIWLPRALERKKMNLFALQSVCVVLFQTLYITMVMSFFYWNSVYGTPHDSTDKLAVYAFSWGAFFSAMPAAALINGTACGLRFYQEHTRIEKNHAQLQQAHLEAQLRILQDQINPHLMFNVLNHMHILMQKDVERASVLLIRFSDILRYQLYECNREAVLLEREVKYLKDMVEVEKIRWGEELKVDCSWDVTNGKQEIMPLLLSPFVENAFKHVSRMPSEKGFVNLVLTQQENQLVFMIENSSSVQQPRKDNSHGLGLENVHKRLEILYPQRYILEIEKMEKIFRVTLTLQFIPQPLTS